MPIIGASLLTSALFTGISRICEQRTSSLCCPSLCLLYLFSIPALPLPSSAFLPFCPLHSYSLIKYLRQMLDSQTLATVMLSSNLAHGTPPGIYIIQIPSTKSMNLQKYQQRYTNIIISCATGCFVAHITTCINLHFVEKQRS